jgi:multimeric flavodoxin WrbA
LTTVLNTIHDADALILGLPIYFGTVTGEMKSFMERLLSRSSSTRARLQPFLKEKF